MAEVSAVIYGVCITFCNSCHFSISVPSCHTFQQEGMKVQIICTGTLIQENRSINDGTNDDIKK